MIVVFVISCPLKHEHEKEGKIFICPSLIFRLAIDFDLDLDLDFPFFGGEGLMRLFRGYGVTCCWCGHRRGSALHLFLSIYRSISLLSVGEGNERLAWCYIGCFVVTGKEWYDFPRLSGPAVLLWVFYGFLLLRDFLFKFAVKTVFCGIDSWSQNNKCFNCATAAESQNLLVANGSSLCQLMTFETNFKIMIARPWYCYQKA